jgi:hypothetical protein
MTQSGLPATRPWARLEVGRMLAARTVVLVCAA